MKKIFAAVAACVCLGILACAGLGCKEDGTNTDNYQAIDSPLQLTVAEQLGTTHTLILHAATERLYGCANYVLVATPSTTDSTYTVSFDNVLEPSVCSPGNLPARVDVPLGALASGHYKLTLRVNGVSVNAPLLVTDTSMTVSGGEGRWTTFVKTYTHKVPSNFIWGNMQSNDPNASAVFRSFNDSLIALGAQIHVYPSTDYGYFQIDGTGNIVAPSSSSIFVKTFVYQYSGDKDEGAVSGDGRSFKEAGSSDGGSGERSQGRPGRGRPETPLR